MWSGVKSRRLQEGTRFFHGRVRWENRPVKDRHASLGRQEQGASGGASPHHPAHVHLVPDLSRPLPATSPKASCLDCFGVSESPHWFSCSDKTTQQYCRLTDLKRNTKKSTTSEDAAGHGSCGQQNRHQQPPDIFGQKPSYS